MLEKSIHQKNLKELFSKYRLNQTWVAKSLGMEPTAFSKKIQGYQDVRFFTSDELIRIYDFLSDASDQITIECMGESFKIKEKLRNLAP